MINLSVAKNEVDMRGLALATLFLGLCLLNEVDAEKQKGLGSTRFLLFFATLIVIGIGA